MKKLFSILTLILLIPTFAFAGGSVLKNHVKAGFVYVGPVGDHGWTYMHDQGRQMVEDELGDKVTTMYVESVPEGPDAARVMRDMAQSGADIIFTTSFGYMDQTLKVAKEFPDVKFEHATGYKTAENVSVYSSRFYEGRYIQGVKESQAAEVLISNGADIITQHTDSPAPLQTAGTKGVLAFGQASDMIQFAPDTQLTSIMDYWGPYYVSRVKALMSGMWESSDTWGGMNTGMVGMAAYTNMPDEVKKAAQEIEFAILNGDLNIFEGISDDNGLLGMMSYLDGIDATVPN